MAMVAATALIIIGQALNLKDTNNAGLYVSRFAALPDRYYAAELIAGIGMLLLIPTSVGVMQLLRGRGATLGTIGGVMGGIGAAAFTITVATVDRVLVPGHQPTAVVFQHVGRHSTFGGVPFFVGMLFLIGMLVLAAGLLRARVVPRWQAILLIVGVVTVGASNSPNGVAAFVGLPILVTSGLLASALVRSVTVLATAAPPPGPAVTTRTAAPTFG